MISYIVPTTGLRASLGDTFRSIELRGDDELIVVGNCDVLARPERGTYVHLRNAHDWGATERAIGVAVAKQPYLAFMDDDDVYLPGARDAFAAAIAERPDRPTLFRMRYPDGRILWDAPILACGNVSTQMMLIPNDKAKLGHWQTGRRECDYDFLVTSRWAVSEFVWRTELICQRSHEKYEP